MTLSSKARKLVTASPADNARALQRRVSQASTSSLRRRRLHARSSYSIGSSAPRRLRTLFPDGIRLPPNEDPSATVAVARFADGWFDVLGSGWRCWQDVSGRPASDLVNAANRPASRRIEVLGDLERPRLDWHVDLHSGHRWDPGTFHADVTWGSGMDVKVPWELARLQHLPQMAAAYGRKRSGDGPGADGLWHAARSQVLDFVAANPPWFGVNWACAMDAGIRVANLVLAVGMFEAQGAAVDRTFEEVVAHAVVDHARFVRANLEWHDRFRSNHYLSDIVGLVFAAAALEPDAESAHWLDFGFDELFREAFLQFDRDGCGAEGSTSYHRLSAELLTYGAALALGLGRQVPSGLAVLLEGAARFTEAYTAPDGRAVQIGDNDSGRFCQPAPAWQTHTVAGARARFANLASYNALPDAAPHPVADSLDHAHLGAAIAAICPALAADLGGRVGIDNALVGALACGRSLPRHRGSVRTTTVGATVPRPPASESDLTTSVLVLRPGGVGLAEAATLEAFPSFGLAVVRTARAFLTFRCGPLGQRGQGGHAHNDQLGIELWIDGVPWVRDPGTFVYTRHPATRNRYRSAAAHAVPRAGDEQYSVTAGLFELAGPGDGGRLLYARDREIVGELDSLAGFARRAVRILDDRIEITDTTTGGSSRGSVVDTPEAAVTALLADPLPFSPGYGWQASDGAP
jgi:hypothetical protein